MEKKEITKNNKKEVQKKVKKVSAKKLPKLYKKSYSPKVFEKKVLKHLYIQIDKDFVKDLFVLQKDKKDKDVYIVPKDKELSKKDFARYKVLASQIKSQKGGIKIIPLIAVIVLICAIGVCVTLFKNVVLEKVITSSMQKIFNAKTDIQKVDIKFFDSSIEIIDLQQANKDSPMKNLFQIDNIKLNFNLTHLLRGKFYAEDMVVSGVALDTDRKTSGTLPVVIKEKKQKKQEEQINKKTQELKQNAATQLQNMFASYNPQNVINNIQEELKSPQIAKDISSDLQAKITKWQETPVKLQTQINDFSKSVEAVTKTNWGGINNAAKLKEALETVNTAIEQGNKLKITVDKTSSDIKTDTNDVKKYSQDLENAIKADTSLVTNKISEMKNMFSVSGIQKIMNEAIESMLYNIFGKYYPYVSKVLDSAMSVKPKEEKTETTKKETKQKTQEVKKERLKGRDIYYKKDTVPKFLIQNVVASGYEYGTNNLLFEGKGTEISNNQDIRQKPSSVDVKFKVMGNNNNASIVIDSRSNTKAPLINMNYSGSGYPIAGDVQVFKFDSKANINAVLKAQKDGSFSVGGSLDMNMNQMQAMVFEPQRVCSLYQNALSNVSKLNIGFTINYKNDGSLSVVIENPEKLANQLVRPIVLALEAELNSIANEAKQNVSKALQEKTNGSSKQIEEFMKIANAVNNSKDKMNDLNKQLEAKKKEINKKLEEQAKQAASSAIKNLLSR